MDTTRFRVTVPELPKDGLQSAKKMDQENIGRKWLLFQCPNLLANGYPQVHLFACSTKAAEIVFHVLHRLG